MSAVSYLASRADSWEFGGPGLASGKTLAKQKKRILGLEHGVSRINKIT